MKLGLGTVQFGVDYGISNQQGKTSIDEVFQILSLAEKYQIKTLDTAALYGNSEEVLGQTLRPSHNFEIITKTMVFQHPKISREDAEKVVVGFESSCQKLRVTSVYGLLIHSSQNLITEGSEYLWERMQYLKDKGKIAKIGVSVYNQQEIEQIMNKFPIDIIQAPCNLFDQNLVTGGILRDLKSAGIEIHVRSAFLQGLLLMNPEDLPHSFKPIYNHFLHYKNNLSKIGISPLTACLVFLKNIPEIDRIICGVNSYNHLLEIINAYHDNTQISKEILSSFALSTSQFINPSTWKID